MSVTRLRWDKKKNTDTKNDTRIRKFFRKKTNYKVKSTIVKRPCCLRLTPLPARLLVTFFWHNADLTSEVTSKVWRQNKEFDSLMSGSTSNLKMYVTCPGPVRLQIGKSQKGFVFESQNTVKLMITLRQSLRQFS